MAYLQRNSKFSSIILVLLRGIRLERGIHQGYVAESAGKSPSAWSKVEAGSSQLEINSMFGAVRALNLNMSNFMAMVDKLGWLLSHYGGFYFQPIPSEEDDDLIPLSVAYFNSAGYVASGNGSLGHVGFGCLDNSFGFGSIMIPDFVRYCCEPEFKKWMDDGGQHALRPAFPSSSTL